VAQLMYDATAAAGYERGFARISSHFIPFLLGAAGVSAGHRVLDVATGTGLAAEAALGLVGPTGHSPPRTFPRRWRSEPANG
jgi:tRNA A58 N-methylase Trm61